LPAAPGRLVGLGVLRAARLPEGQPAQSQPGCFTARPPSWRPKSAKPDERLLDLIEFDRISFGAVGAQSRGHDLEVVGETVA
jgi:hypothetical protein